MPNAQRQAQSAETPSVAPSARWRQRVRLGAFVVLFVLLSLSGAATSVCVLGRSVYRWHGFAVELRLLPSMQGQTHLVLTPLGEVYAHTHTAPVALIASLQEIRIEEIKKLLTSSPNRQDLAREFERQAHADLRNFVTRQVVLAALGGLIAPLLLRSRRLRAYLIGSLLGVTLMGSVLGSTFSTFNGKAFETPVYTGALRQAPWVIAFARDAFTKIEALSQKLRTVAGNLNTLYGRLAALPDRLVPDEGPSSFRVLHVSDLHNNLAAFEFIREVADDFHVAFIVDTGDLTDFGSPPETVIAQNIARLPYPYVVVLGNHDSQTIAAALAKAPNVTLLQGTQATIEGLTLLGVPDPASARLGLGSVDAAPADLQAGGEALLRTITTLPVPPDIVALHDPAETVPLWNHVPLILCGHEHRMYVDVKEPAASATPPTGTPASPSLPPPTPTVICNAGTTGAAGGRYLQNAQGVPLSCAVLTFHRPPAAAADAPTPPRPNTEPIHSSPSTQIDGSPATRAHRPQLRAIDLISLSGSFGVYSISHYTFNTKPQPPALTP